MDDTVAELTVLRRRIDALDQQMIEALSERWKVLAQIRALKTQAKSPPVDPERERQLLHQWTDAARRLALPEAVAEAVLRAILNESRVFVQPAHSEIA